VIDVELLFTIKPFGGLLAASGPGGNTSASSSSSGGGGGGGGGVQASSLGHLAYIQPGASVVLQLQQKDAGTTAVAETAAAGGGGGVQDVDINLDALFPSLSSSSVLVEVVGRGITRTLPRWGSNTRARCDMYMHMVETPPSSPGPAS
jgi:hypothetical protein